MISTDLREVIADRIRSEHHALATRWFERLLALLSVDARDIFASESLLDHIPALILEIGGYLREPEGAAIAANTCILGKARELGALRHSQHASLHQLLREYQLLNGVLVTFVMEEIGRLELAPPAAQTITVVSRLNQAVNVLTQSTIETFVALYTETISAQNERLDQFMRMAAHEWRQPLSALQFGVRLLQRTDLTREESDRTLAAVERSVGHLVELTHKLEAIARMQDLPDNPVVQQVSVTTVAHEAARQLREMAEARGVSVRIADDMPMLFVEFGRLELVLVNLLSNAIKYSDPAKPHRRVEIAGALLPSKDCRIEVTDNGIGIPEQALTSIFRRFTRGHADRNGLSDIDGIGLGLAISEDCVRAMGGRIEVRSVEYEGSVFVVTLPSAPPGKAAVLAEQPDADGGRRQVPVDEG
jgi:signal transduction histidine kinase